MAGARLLKALLAVGALSAPQAGFAAAGDGRPPMIGRDGPELDACVGIGRVSFFDQKGDGTLIVRETPSAFGRESDVLEPGELVWLCDAEGEFQGIVYAAEDYQKLGECRVSRSIAVPEPYDGPCAHGWVTAARLQLVTD